MNGAAVKASAREIRRAFGQDAANAIEQHTAALQHHTVKITECQVELDQIQKRENTHYHQLSQDMEAVRAAIADMRKPRSFRERLRYLLRGK